MLIPFAIALDTGEYVDVFDVKQGRQCGCVCPSCGQGVLARQGDVNEWHFAHDDDSPVKPKQIPCEVSFYGTLKSYIVELLLKKPVKHLRTPSYEVIERQHEHSMTGLKQLVTQERLLDINHFQLGEQFDLSTEIKGNELCIHFIYPGRRIPEVTDFQAGVLLFNLEYLRGLYLGFDRITQTVPNLIVHFFEETVSGKEWHYHPREAKIRAELKEQLAKKLPRFANIRQELFGYRRRR